jgi:hypothetical protein
VDVFRGHLAAMPQPNFVPVMPRMSRNTQSSGMSEGASSVFFSAVNPNRKHFLPVCYVDLHAWP